MPRVPVYEAKNKLTMLRREALVGKEFLLADVKRKDDQPVSLISTALLDELCEAKIFSYEWLDEPKEENEHYSLYNLETGVYGVGITKLEAVEDFINNINDYAEVYFNDLPFYLSPSGDRRDHYWFLRRVLRCDGHGEKLYHVLGLNKVLSN